MMLFPVGTDVRLRHPPYGNYALIVANILIFVFTDWFGGWGGRVLKEYWTLDAQRPLLWQYLTYQFLHGDFYHLLGNMVFLWIFGGAVCDRMGTLPFLLFYLAGGVVSGVTFAATAEHPIVGASGSIAAVTTAFLALYPKVNVRLILWVFVLLTPLTIPSTLLIVFKIILWDNILAPALDQGSTSNVAYSAHLGGYAFGFAVAMLLLYTRVLPRNPLDMAGLWRRRTGVGIGLPGVGVRGGGLSGGGAAGGVGMARPVRAEQIGARPLEPIPLSPLEQLREDAIERVRERDYRAAADSYEQLRQADAATVLPQPQQRELANHLAQSQLYEAAAHAYEGLLRAYPASPDAGQVHLLLGLILNRYLAQPAAAVPHLAAALEQVQSESERGLAFQELQDARGKVG